MRAEATRVCGLSLSLVSRVVSTSQTPESIESYSELVHMFCTHSIACSTGTLTLLYWLYCMRYPSFYRHIQTDGRASGYSLRELLRASAENSGCCLTYADVCWRMLTYADVCWYMLILRASAENSGCWRMLTYADVCWRMLIYADTEG